MSYNCKNYTTDGGNTTVFGGAVVFEEGATVTGLAANPLNACTANTLGGVKLAENVAAIEDTAELADVIAAVNALLTALKASGAVAADA